ncbi:MAG: DUF2225 domain-containing protein [Lachnospiraceae bacterium]|nr:DUF2225 domain-containing protein [Lachnospiraceae bacterium]
MKGIFSGLDKLGLGKLEKVEVFENDSKKEGEKKAAEKTAALTEADFLFEKTYICPVCDKEFHSKKVRTGKVKLLAADTDLRPKYQHVDCLKYDAVACPHCGYAALDRFFKFMMPAQARLIRENISANFKGLPATDNIYTYDDALERHQLALLNTVIKKAKESERAYTCLKMAWICRGKAESLPEETPDRKKQLEELHAQEKELLENAYTGFQAAFSKETFPMCGMDEVTVSYLLAELARRIGKYEESSRWISRVLISREANERIKNRAREIKELLNKDKEHK